MRWYFSVFCLDLDDKSWRQATRHRMTKITNVQCFKLPTFSRKKYLPTLLAVPTYSTRLLEMQLRFVLTGTENLTYFRSSEVEFCNRVRKTPSLKKKKNTRFSSQEMKNTIVFSFYFAMASWKIPSLRLVIRIFCDRNPEKHFRISSEDNLESIFS